MFSTATSDHLNQLFLYSVYVRILPHGTVMYVFVVMFALYYLFMSIYRWPKSKDSTASYATYRPQTIHLFSHDRSDVRPASHTVTPRRSRIKNPLGVRVKFNYSSFRAGVYLLTNNNNRIVENMYNVFEKKKGLYIWLLFGVRYSERLIFIFTKFISETSRLELILDSK